LQKSCPVLILFAVVFRIWDLGQQQQTTEWETAVSPTAAGVLSSWKAIKRQQENDKKTGHDKFCHARVKKCFFPVLKSEPPEQGESPYRSLMGTYSFCFWPM
jgi:hypothetical protein